MLTFGYVPPPVPGPLWRACEPLISAALDRSGDYFDMTDVASEVAHGLAQLWVAREDGRVVGAVLTQAADDGDCVIWAMGGEMRCIPFILDIEARARADGFPRMWLSGRAGWARLLQKYGWKIERKDGVHVTLVRELR